MHEQLHQPIIGQHSGRCNHKTSRYKSISGALIHADHLNTPRVIVDQTNTIVWRWDNTHAFGANLPNEDPDGHGQLFEYYPRFPGQYFDKETGLHYNYFRYYEPETGRYISPDPIGLAAGMNAWGYVGQNPLSFIDPTGLDVNITITRDTYTENTVTGKINVSSTLIRDTYSGNTLEDAIGGDCQCKDPISPGKYDAFIRKDHNPNRIELKGVPNYTNVQIHIGNSARDVKGCFAVGDTRGLDFVGGSRPAMSKILDIIRKDGSGNITVNVIGPNRSTTTP